MASTAAVVIATGTFVTIAAGRAVTEHSRKGSDHGRLRAVIVGKCELSAAGWRQALEVVAARFVKTLVTQVVRLWCALTQWSVARATEVPCSIREETSEERTPLAPNIGGVLRRSGRQGWRLGLASERTISIKTPLALYASGQLNHSRRQGRRHGWANEETSSIKTPLALDHIDLSTGLALTGLNASAGRYRRSHL